jgi:hypothetical protein
MRARDNRAFVPLNERFRTARTNGYAQKQDERSLRPHFMRHRGEAVGPPLITGKPLTVEKYSEEFLKEFAQDVHR